MLVVLVVHLSTVFYSLDIFTSSKFMCNRTTYVALFVFRLMLVVSIVVLMFTAEGKELSYGFWIVTSVCFFICLELY
jgi:hypothetical protein